MGLLIAFGDFSLFSVLAPVTMIGLIPLLYLLTKVYLRDVSPPNRLDAGIRLSLLATAVQFPLDALVLLSIYKLDWPQLKDAAQQSTILALLIGYFFLLTVPWSVSARERSVAGAV